MKKRIFSLLLAMICACACLVGCKGEEGDQPSLEPAREKYEYTQGVHQLTADATGEYMIKDGKTDYKILMPADADSYLFVAESEIKYFFEEATGVLLETVIEPKEGLAHDANGRYISLGDTKMLASSGVDVKKDTIGSQGVRIATKDKTIYLAGASTVGTLNGVYTLLQIMFNYD